MNAERKNELLGYGILLSLLALMAMLAFGACAAPLPTQEVPAVIVAPAAQLPVPSADPAVGPVPGLTPVSTPEVVTPAVIPPTVTPPTAPVVTPPVAPPVVVPPVVAPVVAPYIDPPAAPPAAPAAAPMTLTFKATCALIPGTTGCTVVADGGGLRAPSVNVTVFTFQRPAYSGTQGTQVEFSFIAVYELAGGGRSARSQKIRWLYTIATDSWVMRPLVEPAPPAGAPLASAFAITRLP